ncbi:DNA repair proteins [Peptoniphilus sp. ING2-D1G]|nr:DNA repair proteins [Peptoniphilus sp. ING2-D1G]
MENKNYRIKDLPLEDRPQEKLLKLGPQYLSNAELIALIIRTGTKTKTSVELSQEILNSFSCDYKKQGISVLKQKSIKDFLSIKGVGVAKAAMLMAAVTLADRMNSESVFKRNRADSPQSIAHMVMQEMKDLVVEEFRIALLNTKKEVILIKTVSKGILNSTIVHPREVFKIAIDNSAHSIILLHNHPSGDSKASPDDINITGRLCESGKLLGIEVIDHIIIGDGEYFSFKERGLL